MINKLIHRIYDFQELRNYLINEELKVEVEMLDELVIDLLASARSIKAVLENIVEKVEVKESKRPRKYKRHKEVYKRLTKEDVLDIEYYVDKCLDTKTKPDIKYLCDKYNASNSVIYHIINHEHRFSTIEGVEDV